MFKHQQDHQTDNSLEEDLITLYDEFTKFNDHCSFFCDAYSSIVAQTEDIDPRTARGIDCSAVWIKNRVNEFKESIERIVEAAREKPED